ncbi:MAG: OmpA family protein, partial [Caldilineaceae bacterium]
METVNQDVIDPREDGGTGVEFESRLDEASLDKSSPNASSQQAPTDSAMARLETELLALGVAVERTDTDHLIANLGDYVQFSDGSVTLDADAQAFLEVIAEDLKKSLPLKIRVIGHTDHRGRADVNARLSAKRAENVAQFLEANGIADKSLSYVGRGESEPKISLVDERKLGPAVNRRIELELFTPSPNEEPLFAAGVGLWAAALALVSAFSAMPIFVRATGAIASIMFAVTAVQIY